MESSEDVEKRFLYTGKEQRREAKENFEEKCERKTLGIHRSSKPRWCPELPSWDLWMQGVAKDGVVYPPLKGGGVVNPAKPQVNNNYVVPVQPQVPQIYPNIPVQPPFGRPNPYPPNMNNNYNNMNLPFGRPNPNPQNVPYPQYPNNMNQNPYNPRPDLSQQMFGNQFPNQYRPVG
jgi:hypothetical protein